MVAACAGLDPGRRCGARTSMLAAAMHVHTVPASRTATLCCACTNGDTVTKSTPTLHVHYLTQGRCCSAYNWCGSGLDHCTSTGEGYYPQYSHGNNACPSPPPPPPVMAARGSNLAQTLTHLASPTPRLHLAYTSRRLAVGRPGCGHRQSILHPEHPASL